METKQKDRSEYMAEYREKNHGADTHRKGCERERMRIAVVYAKFYLLHGRGFPGFVSVDLIEPALEQARKELSLQNVTTLEVANET